MNLSRKNIIILLILIFHFVGMLGLSFSQTKDYFLFLTPFHLLFTSILIFLSKSYSRKFFLSVFLISFIGFFIEVLGVYTGLLFGEYDYGNNLGLEILNVPLVIALNWFILVYASRGSVNYFIKNKYLQILFSSIIMVFLDILIEPVAIELGWWSWDISSVPLQNYLMWFVVSVIMQVIISNNNHEISKSISISLLLSQISFFIYLNITII